MEETDSLLELKKKLIADGHLDENDVEILRNALEKGGMTKEKGDFLFDFKDNMSKDRITPSFSRLFINSISELLLEDEVSPGEIDDGEAKWLRAKIQHKGYLDKTDHKLLDNLRKKSINYPDVLNYKGGFARWFESTLYFSRYLTLLAVAGSLISAIILFIRGVLVVAYGIKDFFASFGEPKGGDYELLLATFVSSVDIFLFAMVLVIFGMGIYELFINKIDPVERKADARPSWLQISSIDELKSSLGKVILMVLIVSFFKHSLDIPFNSAGDLLQLSIGVLLIAAALFLAHKQKH